MTLYKKSIFKIISFSIIGIIVLLGGIYFKHRIHLMDLPPEAVVPESVGQFNSRLGWSPKPNSHAISNRTGQEILYRIDSNGRRAIDNSESDSRCRVVAIGDSNTFGFAINIEDHWLTQLRQHLPQLEIQNLGVNGYGVDQALLRFRYEGKITNPALVIFYVKHFSDDRHISAISWGKTKPYFLLDKNNQLELHDKHIADQNVDHLKIKLGYKNKPDMLMRLGVKIIQQAESEATQSGAKFLLLAGWPRLCTDDIVKNCLNMRNIGAYPVITTTGENLLHVNAQGSKILAQITASYIQHKKLLPEFCFK